MAIGVRAVVAAVYSANGVTPAMPVAQEVGDLCVFIASGKPYNLGWSVGSAGWNALGRGESGTTAAGIDLGSMVAQGWYNIADADPETAPTLTEGSPTFNVIGGWLIVFSKDASETWETPVLVFGLWETDNVNVSVTFASDPGVTAGDLILCFIGANTDAFGPVLTILTPAQTGVTFGTTTSQENSETATGGDMAFHATTTPVNSGTGSAAPTATAVGTLTGPDVLRCELGFMRLRVTAAPPGGEQAFPVVAGV